MRKLVLAAGVLALAVAPAFADGPGGSHEEDGTAWDNQVTCGAGTTTPAGGVVYAGGNGAEVCNDGGAIPLQGRIIVSTDQGGYVAADGDASNPEQHAQGWVRVDGSGVRCGDDNGNLDATHPTSADTIDDCG